MREQIAERKASVCFTVELLKADFSEVAAKSIKRILQQISRIMITKSLLSVFTHRRRSRQFIVVMLP